MITLFFLMSHCKDSHRFAIEAVKRDITAASEIDQPFSKLRPHLFNRASGLRLMSQYFYTCPYCPDGPACRCFVF